MKSHTLRFKRMQRFFTEPYRNLETEEFYSSEFTRSAARMALQLKKQWTLLACTTAFLMYMTMAPNFVAPIRRRLPGSSQQRPAPDSSSAQSRMLDEEDDVHPLFQPRQHDAKLLEEYWKFAKEGNVEEFRTKHPAFFKNLVAEMTSRIEISGNATNRRCEETHCRLSYSRERLYEYASCDHTICDNCRPKARQWKAKAAEFALSRCIKGEYNDSYVGTSVYSD